MIHIFKNPEAVLPAIADFIVAAAKASVKESGLFNFVLSGGSSPKKLYELLTSPAYRKSIDWQHVFFFFGDERYVPLDDSNSNYRMANEALFTPLDINADHIFEVKTNLSPEEAAADYEQRIRTHFKDGDCRFDLILLGLGDNSHTASLFPHTSVLHETKALVKEIFVDEVNMYRITLTAPLINAAKSIAFLVYGEGKAKAVRHILKDPLLIEEYPAQLIKPDQGQLHWFLDEAAASEIA